MFRFEEKILLYQISKGNERAFVKFYDSYRESLYRFILLKVSEKEKAEELTNNVFIKIYDYLRQGKKIENLRALLYQTARNLIIDFYRQKKQQDLSIDEFKEKNISEEKRLEKEVDTKLSLEKVEENLKKLPDLDQEVIILRFIEGLPFKEIAKILRINEETAKQRSHRALKKLKNLIFPVTK